jgi:predicted NAD/FAD-binding protein
VQAITARVADKRLNTPVLSLQRDDSGVVLHTPQHSERFDHVVIATHADQALRMLAQPSDEEQALLSRIGFQDNLAVLHTDASVMPRERLAWAAWNYQRTDPAQENARVCLHYWLNKLQPLPFKQDVFVSLNPTRDIAAQHVLGQFSYAHPVFDLTAIQAQRQLHLLQGKQHTWFAGAWMGYGFHEDGLRAAQSVVTAWRAKQALTPSQVGA